MSALDAMLKPKLAAEGKVPCSPLGDVSCGSRLTLAILCLSQGCGLQMV